MTVKSMFVQRNTYEARAWVKKVIEEEASMMVPRQTYHEKLMPAQATSRPKMEWRNDPIDLEYRTKFMFRAKEAKSCDD